MTSSAEQLHHARLDPVARGGVEERLFIDLDICSGKCAQCEVQCSYHQLYRNRGIVSLSELATYALVCRRCEEPHCVKACPVDALEQDKARGAMLTRHAMLCISCDSCSHACPYGTIYPEYVPLLIHNCDFCLDRRGAEGEPLCVGTCSQGALRLQRGDAALGDNDFLVGDNLVIHSTHWQRDLA